MHVYSVILSGERKITNFKMASRHNNNIKKDNIGNPVMDFIKIQLEQMIEEAVVKATTPLKNEIEMLKAEIVEIKKSQEFV